VNPGPIRTEIWDKLQEPAAFKGRLLPAERIADAVRYCLEHDRFERWYPRYMSGLQIMKLVGKRPFLRGLAWFDRRADR
jgi:hypothetical protein